MPSRLFSFFSFFFGLLTNFMHFLTFGGELTSPVLWNPTCLLLFAAILWLGIFSGKTHVTVEGGKMAGMWPALWLSYFNKFSKSMKFSLVDESPSLDLKMQLGRKNAECRMQNAQNAACSKLFIMAAGKKKISCKIWH